MKANELMIGDLVQVVKDVCIKKDTIVRIRSIDGNNSFPEKGLKGCATCEPIDDRTLSGGVWVEFLAPIQLTSNILLKNGFVDVGQNVYQIEIKPYYVWWESDRCRLGIDVDVSTYEYEDFGEVLRLPIQYIHELQHVLRIVGIDKEIIL